MNEYPMSFNTDMARAVHAGTKTMTRRPVDPQLSGNHLDSFLNGPWLGKPFGGLLVPRIRDLPLECPHGRPGDILWMREPFVGWFDTTTLACTGVAEWAADGYVAKSGERMATPNELPRELCRQLLEIVDVRVERLQDISTEDIIAEGIEQHVDEGVTYFGPYGRGDARPEAAFAKLWDSIYGIGAWASNPWAWAITFRKVPA